MFRNGLTAVAVVCGALGMGSTAAKADHYYRSSCGGYGRPAPTYVSYAPSYYRPVYAYAPVEYYPPVTYVSRPVYYPPVRVARPYYAPVRHRHYEGYYGPSGIGFSYGSRHRGFSVRIGH